MYAFYWERYQHINWAPINCKESNINIKETAILLRLDSKIELQQDTNSENYKKRQNQGEKKEEMKLNYTKERQRKRISRSRGTRERRERFQSQGEKTQRVKKEEQ